MQYSGFYECSMMYLPPRDWESPAAPPIKYMEKRESARARIFLSCCLRTNEFFTAALHATRDSTLMCEPPEIDTGGTSVKQCTKPLGNLQHNTTPAFNVNLGTQRKIRQRKPLIVHVRLFRTQMMPKTPISCSEISSKTN